MKNNRAEKRLALLFALLLLATISCSHKPDASNTSKTVNPKASQEKQQKKNGSNAKLSIAESVFQVQPATEQNLLTVMLTADQFIRDEALFTDENLIVNGLPDGAEFTFVAVGPTRIVFLIEHKDPSLVGQYTVKITFSEAVFQESVDPVTVEIQLLFGVFAKQYQREIVSGSATVPRLDGLLPDATVQLISAPKEGVLTQGDSALSEGQTVSVDMLNSGELFYKSTLDYEWYGADRIDSIVFEVAETKERILIQYTIQAPTFSHLPVPPNAWFDASSRNSLMIRYGVFAEDGQQLAVWRDHSQNNVPAFAPSNRPRPHYIRQPYMADIERPAVMFNDVGNRFERELGLVKEDGFSAYSYAGAFQLSQPNVDNKLHSIVTANDGRGGLFVSDEFVASRNFSGNENFIVGTSALATEWFVASNSNSLDGAIGHKLFLNGRLEATDNTYPDITNFSQLTLGDAQTSVEQSFLGNIGEVLFFDEHLSDYALLKVDEYLTLRWGNGRFNDARNAPESVSINASSLGGRHFIYDSQFDDTILGSQQNDMVYLHDGNDLVSGNLGADRFIFLGSGQKTISDFDSANDVLDFSQLVAERQGANFLNYFNIAETDDGIMIQLDPEGQAQFRESSLQVLLSSADMFDASAIQPNWGYIAE